VVDLDVPRLGLWLTEQSVDHGALVLNELQRIFLGHRADDPTLVRGRGARFAMVARGFGKLAAASGEDGEAQDPHAAAPSRASRRQTPASIA
jgi:hypothetical protein